MLVSAFMISRVARNQTGIGHPGPVTSGTHDSQAAEDHQNDNDD